MTILIVVVAFAAGATIAGVIGWHFYRAERAQKDLWMGRALVAEDGTPGDPTEDLVKRGILDFNAAHPDHPQARAMRTNEWRRPS